MSTSYDSIAKWAREAISLLEEGNLAGVATNLTMILNQANEEIDDVGDGTDRDLKGMDFGPS